VDTWWAEAGIGLGAGMAGGLLGLGGGFIMVPAMVLLLGVGQQEAQGASLAVSVVIAAVATFTNLRAGLVGLREAWWIALPAMAASIAGASIANAVPEEVLRRIFGALVALVALYVLRSALSLRTEAAVGARDEPDCRRPPDSDDAGAPG